MEQKQQILDKSGALFMRYGIKSVTMDDIAREMGISKKTLYQYVDNKADLIEKIIQQKINCEKNIMAEIRQDSTDAIHEILKIGRYVINQLRNLSPTIVYDLKKYYRSTWKLMENLHKRQTSTIIKENLERGVKEQLYRNNINADIIAKLFVGKNSMVADEDLFPKNEYDVKELFRESMDYHIHGIASAKGLKLLEQYLAEGKEIKTD